MSARPNSTPNMNHAHLNHYDELVEMLRRHWHASTCRCDNCIDRRALLARLPNQGKAAVLPPPPAPADVLADTPENVERVARIVDVTGIVVELDRMKARRILAALREARDLPPNSDSKGKG